MSQIVISFSQAVFGEFRFKGFDLQVFSEPFEITVCDLKLEVPNWHLKREKGSGKFTSIGKSEKGSSPS
jgi:hypothetical protein